VTDGALHSGSDYHPGPVTIAGGKIQVLDLALVQERLGLKWQRLSLLVHKYFEAAIKQELSPGDSFCHRGELEYLVTFRHATLAEARLKCLAISQFACERLFGKDGHDLVVRNLTAPLDLTDLSTVEGAKRADLLLEECGEETLCSRGGEKPRTPPRKLLTLSLGDRRRHQMCVDQAPFVYRPFWDSQKHALFTYLVQPFPETCEPGTRFYAPPTALPAEPAQCELDILCIKAAQARAQAVRRAGGRLLIVVPLHFTTVCRPRYWLRYRAEAADMAPEDIFDMLFLLHGVDQGVPNVRLIQEIPKLALISRRIFCLAENADGIQRQFDNTGIQGLGLVARRGEPERVLIARLDMLHAATRASGLESFLLGAAKRSMVVNAIGAGIRYIEGAGMRPAVAEPKFAVAQDIVDYYRTAAA
jgi:hypothetical protein